MASQLGASISNPAGFAALLSKMSDPGSESTLRHAAVAGARVVMDEVVLRAPVGPFPHIRSGKLYPPGTLKKSIIIFHDDQKSSVPGALQVYAVTIARDAFYALMVEKWHPFSGFVATVEHGSSKVPAHPFFRPAVDAKGSAATEAMVAVMKKKLDEAKNG